MIRKMAYFSVLILFFPRILLHAQCTGSGTTWSCAAGSSVAQIQSAINSASNGATITFAAGSYTLSSWIAFSNSAGATLICATAPQTIGAASTNPCTINFTTNTVFGGSSFSGTNTYFYRISGFVFDAGAASSGFTIWFDNASACGGSGVCPVTMSGPNGLGGIRIDHNTFQDMGSGVMSLLFGHANNSGATNPVGHYYGVIDHNSWTNSTQMTPLEYLGWPDPTPPTNQLGTVNNLFFETNTINFAAMPSASSGGCTDAEGLAAYVIRYNTSNDCLWAVHGATHGGGTPNVEFYNNAVTLDSNATGESPIDCYRCFHHQGSGTFVAFNNTFTAPGGYDSEIISMANYRGYANGPSIDGGIVACDGTVSGASYDAVTFSDGNSTPGGSNYGYPCWHQPGRDFSGNYAPMYAWNNVTGGGAEVGIVNPDFGGTVPNGSYPPNNCTTTSSGNCDYNSFQMKPNREWFNAVSASAQSSSSSPFNGTTGMGFGTLANRPTTCTTSSEPGAGVGYFAEDTNTLYTCSATNTWSVYYQPYTYPHPLLSGAPPQAPAPPTGVTAVAH
jgi:hypothetical protein